MSTTRHQIPFTSITVAIGGHVRVGLEDSVDFEPAQISGDHGFWSALSLVWFDQICPPNQDGSHKVDKEYRYILSSAYNTYYRHLVRSPWHCVRMHGEHARFLLRRSREVDYPLSIHGEILEQFGGRQRLFGSRAIIRAANAMYLDPDSGMPRTGVAGAGQGSALRFGKVVRQYDLTIDPECLSVDEFLELLPREFSRWTKDYFRQARNEGVADEKQSN